VSHRIVLLCCVMSARVYVCLVCCASSVQKETLVTRIQACGVSKSDAAAMVRVVTMGGKRRTRGGSSLRDRIRAQRRLKMKAKRGESTDASAGARAEPDSQQ